mmetsp:Transcript_11283/g.27099  ORF Transcript_11283/g.27099 Transcript_11283/m.27099 type:complete len:204 (+) Transcript_11283:5239-5850(+)
MIGRRRPSTLAMAGWRWSTMSVVVSWPTRRRRAIISIPAWGRKTSSEFVTMVWRRRGIATAAPEMRRNPFALSWTTGRRGSRDRATVAHPLESLSLTLSGSCSSSSTRALFLAGRFAIGRRSGCVWAVHRAFVFFLRVSWNRRSYQRIVCFLAFRGVTAFSVESCARGFQEALRRSFLVMGFVVYYFIGLLRRLCGRRGCRTR